MGTDLLLGFQGSIRTALLSWSSHKPQIFHNSCVKPTALMYWLHKNTDKKKRKNLQMTCFAKRKSKRGKHIFAHVTFTSVRVMYEGYAQQRNRGREKRYFSFFLPRLKVISTFLKIKQQFKVIYVTNDRTKPAGCIFKKS